MNNIERTIEGKLLQVEETNFNKSLKFGELATEVNRRITRSIVTRAQNQSCSKKASVARILSTLKATDIVRKEKNYIWRYSRRKLIVLKGP